MLKSCFGKRGVGIRKWMHAPHGRKLLGLIRPRGRVGRVLRANDQLEANALRRGSLGKIDALVINSGCRSG